MPGGGRRILSCQYSPVAKKSHVSQWDFERFPLPHKFAPQVKLRPPPPPRLLSSEGMPPQTVWWEALRFYWVILTTKDIFASTLPLFSRRF